MLLKNESWMYPNSLPEHICSDIIKYCLNKKNIERGTVRDNSISKIRNSFVVWNDEPWLKNTVMHYIKDANKNAGWNFDIETCEDIQFTIYGGDQHYDWHVDAGDEVYQTGKHKGLIRKISASILLNNNYEEGDFLFNFRNGNNPNLTHKIKEKSVGTAIVFPSHIRHKVSKVKKGKRYSLVCWSLGKAFK
jgi:predicted 2-oxoglutarate/Fe(II)-dependent dioxygenase YbiX|tara:strand:+ start:3456 stop:4028 length:573 start_codon:yes stop_codon:yes gene_type:complete